MKQHITEKQLNELTIEQSAKLMYSFGNDDLAGGEDVTIGKMFEILNDFPNNYITSIRPKFKKENNKSYVELGIKDLMAEEECIDSWYLKGFHSEELCDALWQAIKEIL